MRGAAIVGTVVWLAALGMGASLGAERAEIGSGEPVLFTADELQHDQDLGLTIAKGHVEVSQGNQILLADTITYNERTDTVTASGNVSFLQPDGNIAFGDFVELRNNMRDGFIKNVRLMLADRSRVAGNTGRRVGGVHTELRRGVYSPCDLCPDDPTAPPLWQIRAERITHDKDLKIVEYRDAIMEIGGWPLLYAPYFSHPDPTVKRQSGFLAPLFGVSNTLGFHTTIPYYWVINDTSDATFRPLFTTQGGIVFDNEYRQRFSFGSIIADGSVAIGSQVQNASPPNPPTNKLRGHLFARSEFDLDENWRTGLNVQRASDPTYLIRYNYPIGFENPSNFLTTRAFGEEFTSHSYADISSYLYQNQNPAIKDSTQPIVAPVASYDWRSSPDPLGGRLRVTANGLNLRRLQGTSERRASLGSEWHVPFNGLIGDRFEFGVSTRGDGYNSSKLLLVPTDTRGVAETTGRVFPQTGLTWHYPWANHIGSLSFVAEPIAAAFAAPNGGNPATIPNIDTQGFEFDESSLFRANRLPGYDRVDIGQRVDYGLRIGAYGDERGSVSLLTGESYRFQQHDSTFVPGAGLEEKRSDVVGRLTISPDAYLDLNYRYRLDKHTLTIRRQEAGLTTGPGSLKLSASYVSIKPLPGVSTVTTSDQISLSLNTRLTPFWTLELNDTRNILGSSATVNAGGALTYRDECIAVSTSITQSGVNVGDVKPGLVVLVSIVFKNLGEIGVRALSVGGAQQQ